MDEEKNEITLMDILNSLKDFFSELKAKWLTVTIIVLLTCLIGLLFSYLFKPTYSATSSMMLESSQSGGGMSGALALASQFGLLGGSTSSVIDEDKLLEIIKAETIIKSALFEDINIAGTNDILANHYINLLGYKERWENVDTLKDFKFRNPPQNLTLREKIIFKLFYKQILETILKVEKTKSGIIVITTTSKSELLSKNLNNCLVKAATSFYTNRITEKGQLELAVIQGRVDSIAGALKIAENTLARWKDGSHQLVKAQGMMVEMDLRREVEVCNSMYVEGIKQLEMSKFTLLQETPFLQIIDEPLLPLEKIYFSKLKGLVMGFIVGWTIAFLYIFGRKKYSELKIKMKEA